MIASIIGALVMGGIVGLIPYFYAKNKFEEKLGMVGLLACVLCNFISGLSLSIPCCIVFLIIILVKS